MAEILNMTVFLILTRHLISDIFNINEQRNWSFFAIYPDKELQIIKKEKRDFA